MKFFEKNDNDCMLIEGENKNTLFLFIHGYATSPKDLLPLAKALNQFNYSCALILLEGHNENNPNKYVYNNWKNQLLNTINYYRNKYDNIYLIGFSIGATLSLDIVSDNNIKCIKGVFGISTFIEPTNKSLLKILKFMNFIKIKKSFRFLQTTTHSTKKEILYDKYLPVKQSISIINKAKNVINKTKNIETKVFLLHSIDDKVADYSTISNISSFNKKIKLITIRELNHFLQFDIPENLLAESILKLFQLQETHNVYEVEKSNIINIYNNLILELNQWSSILYKLIAGFFSVFGALVYFSLPDILSKKSTTPYFLISYTLLTSIFVILGSMYFFYLNRGNTYLKNYIEPYLYPISWISYRTNKFIAGIETIKITKNVALVIMGVPMLIATASLITILYKFLYLSEPNLHNSFFLIIVFFISLFLYFNAINTLIKLSHYTNRELYDIKIQKFENFEQMNTIINLIMNISIGCVKNKN